MMGATAGRTTLHGEGLQHDDGHSHLLASTVPRVRAYDPAYAYELAAVDPRRDRADVRPGRGRLLLRHDLQRELPDGAQARRRRRGDRPRDLPLRRPRRTASPGRAGGSASSGAARSSSRSSRRSASWASGSTSRPRSTARRRSSSSAATRSRSTAGTGSIPDAKARVPYVSRGPRAGRRPGRHRLGLAQGRARPRPAVAARRARSPWAPRDSAGATPARPSGRCSRSTAPSIAAAALRGLARSGGTRREDGGQGRSASSGSTRTRPTRSTLTAAARRSPVGPTSTPSRCRGAGAPRIAMKRTITVRAVGHATTSPDVADVRLGVAVDPDRPSPRRASRRGRRRRRGSLGGAAPPPGVGAGRRPDRVARRPARVRLPGWRPVAPGPVGEPPVRDRRARSRRSSAGSSTTGWPPGRRPLDGVDVPDRRSGAGSGRGRAAGRVPRRPGARRGARGRGRR